MNNQDQANMPTVSVCIPTYNRKTYLQQTIESVKAQTYRDYEIVIVDDGSTDGSGEMIKKLDCPIRYYWQENAGLPKTRNRLIRLARGKYISFLDSDDLLVPDALERLVAVAKTQSQDVIVYGPYLRMDQDGNIFGRVKEKLYSGYVSRHLFERIFVHPNGSLLAKSILQKLGGYDGSLRVCEDYELWLRASLQYRFIGLAEPTFLKRRHSGNMSNPCFENCLAELDVIESFYFKQGGYKRIPVEIALSSFLKRSYRAVKYALRERNYKAMISTLSHLLSLAARTYWRGAVIGHAP